MDNDKFTKWMKNYIWICQGTGELIGWFNFKGSPSLRWPHWNKCLEIFEYLNLNAIKKKKHIEEKVNIICAVDNILNRAVNYECKVFDLNLFNPQEILML